MKVDFSKVKHGDKIKDTNWQPNEYCTFLESAINDGWFYAQKNDGIIIYAKTWRVWHYYEEPKKDIDHLNDCSVRKKLDEVIDRVNEDHSHWVKASDFLKLRESVIDQKTKFLDLQDRVNELSRGRDDNEY